MLRSIRARLAIAMIVTTAILAVIAVTTASRFIRNDLEQDALSTQNQNILELYAIADDPQELALEDPATLVEQIGLPEECLADGGCVFECFDEDCIEGVVCEDPDCAALPLNCSTGETCEEFLCPEREQCVADASSVQAERFLVLELVGQIAASQNANDILAALDLGPTDSFLIRLFPSDTGYDYRVSFDDETIKPLQTGSDDSSLKVVSADSLFGLLETSFNTRLEDRSLAEDAEFAALEFDTSSGPVWILGDVSAERRAADQVQRIFMGGSVFLTLLAGLAAWLLAARALRPVSRITKQVSSITAGSMHERVPEPGTGDEIDRLATTMNGMLERLETGDKRRRQFVSDAAHELRTPVAVLTSEAEVALRTPTGVESSRFASAVLAESNRMGGLVEDLLTLARLDEDRQPHTRQVVDLDELVMAETKRSRRLPIDISAVSAGRVLGHTDELTRVVQHLLDNATRHGHEHVSVGVQTDSQSGRVQLWVDDDGDGIAAQDRERIFERFVRLQEARDRDSGGSGLGLAVVAAIVASLGGTIEAAESTALGGARIQVELPVA